MLGRAPQTLNTSGATWIPRAAASATASAASRAAEATATSRRGYGERSTVVRPTRRRAAKSSVSRRAVSAQPRLPAMDITRTTCWAFITDSSACPSAPTRASAGTGKRSKRRWAKSMPRIPLAGTAGLRSYRPAPSGRSSRTAEKAPGPRSPVRATRYTASQRRPRPTIHFSPVSSQPPSTGVSRAVLASRSLPWSASDRANPTAPPRARIPAACLRCSGEPCSARQVAAVMPNIVPGITFRSRRAAVRTSSMLCSNDTKRPPHSSGR